MTNFPEQPIWNLLAKLQIPWTEKWKELAANFKVTQAPNSLVARVEISSFNSSFFPYPFKVYGLTNISNPISQEFPPQYWELLFPFQTGPQELLGLIPVLQSELGKGAHSKYDWAEAFSWHFGSAYTLLELRPKTVVEQTDGASNENFLSLPIYPNWIPAATDAEEEVIESLDFINTGAAIPDLEFRHASRRPQFYRRLKNNVSIEIPILGVDPNTRTLYGISETTMMILPVSEIKVLSGEKMIGSTGDVWNSLQATLVSQVAPDVYDTITLFTPDSESEVMILGQYLEKMLGVHFIFKVIEECY